MKAFLALEDGTIFEGTSLGASGEVVGDVVFTTAMSGFQECLTDPSYRGKILSFTDPIVDNYGINSDDFESGCAQCVGTIMKDPSETPSNFRCESTMNDFLTKNKVVGICGIDTRMLTRHLRDHGTMKGMISTDPDFDFKKKSALIKAAKVVRPAYDVTTETVREYAAEESAKTVALIDLGVKQSFISALVGENNKVVRFPASVSVDAIKAIAPDGIVISDGPGNPADYPELVKLVKAIAELNRPTLAVGLGNQLLALANGMKIKKMPFGHHGNHPVKDLRSDTVFATFQNQDYTVLPASIFENVATVSHVNMHDNVVEGIAYKTVPTIGLQFYPDSVKGAHNASYLMTAFQDMMK